MIKEVGFDGLTRKYERDFSGLVTKVKRPKERYTAYEHDALGRVVGASYHDGAKESFVYNKNGALIEATNDDVTLKFEYDVTGRIIKEMQDDYEIESTYDELGNRTFITSNLGASIATAHNSRGQATHIAAAQGGKGWVARREYNELGQEVERLLPGNVVNAWQYDSMGRAKEHRVSSNSREMRQKKYEWNVNQQLRRVTNELNRQQTKFSYDEFSNLVKAEYGYRDILHRESDKVGNIYETDDKSDRIYGKGSRLEQSGVNTNELKNKFQGGHGKLVTRGAKYEYDCEGNLVKKTCPHPNPEAWYYGEEKNGKLTRVYKPGPVWEYEYYGNGMLKEVIKPDGEIVTFKYDSLGRRVEKSSNSKIIKFVWDGNNPLHEWSEQAEEIEKYIKAPKHEFTTWVFKDGFVPSAKLTKQGNYSIITDYLGTPVEAYDEAGKKVWEQELDIYGRVKPRPVKKEWGQVVDDGLFDEYFIPFRYQGQYHDQEIDLYYNRFRYYDPELGQYITQDPIGLAGGNPTLYGYVYDPNSEFDSLGLDLYDIVNYGNKISELFNHHPIMDAWAKNNIVGYISRQSSQPTIQLTKELHNAAHAAERAWMKETFGKVRGNWKNMTAQQAQELSEVMFDAAGVPQSKRREFYKRFHEYIYNVRCPKRG